MSLKLKKVAGDLFKKPLFYLAIVLLIGGFFRFYNLDWDFQHSFHPDERNILGQTAGIQPGNGYRVQFFAYGQLPVYLYRFTGELVSTPAFIVSALHTDVLSQWVYWIALAALTFLLGFILIREDLDLIPFGITSFLLLALILFKLNPTFTMWFEALDSVPIKLACVLFSAAASYGISAYLSDVLEIEWVGLPFYVASGAFFFLGVIPCFLPDAFPKFLTAISFTLLFTGLAFWWAWVSRWGRLALGLLAFWGLVSMFQHAGRQYVGYGETMLIGRWWAALFSTATIVVIYHFVNRAYKNKGMALLAAASFAFAAVSIEQAHYCITESFITMMMVVITCLAYEISQTGDWKNYLWVGAAFGLSMAAKTSSLYYVFIILTGHLVFLAKTSKLEWLKIGKKQKENDGIYTVLAALLMVVTFGAFVGVGIKLNGVIHDLFAQDPVMANILWGIFCAVLVAIGAVLSVWGLLEIKVVKAQMPQWFKLTAVGGLAFFIFCLLSPWSLLDFNGFSNSMNYEWHVVSISDACYVIQFKDTLRYIFQLSNLMSVELWWPLGITAVLGMIYVLVRFFMALFNVKKSGYLLPAPFMANKGFVMLLPEILILSWFIPYFGFIGAWNTKFIRYMVPLIPAFCIFAADLLMTFLQWVKSKASFARFLKPVLLTLIVGSSFFYSLAYMHVYRYLHPWIESSIWIFKNVPQGSMVLKEAWDDGLPTGVDHSIDPRVEGNMGPQNYRQQDVTIYEMHGFNTDDTPIKKNYYANIIHQGDYISIASKKLWYTLTACTPEFKPHGYNVYPVTSRYYRLLWSGLLGYKMVGEFHNFPGIFGWEHPDDMAEESFSVYDHPRVYIFKKVEDVPIDRILKLLSSDDYVKGIDRDMMRNITPANVDAFIAQRHEYLEKMGLLQGLDETSPVKAVPTPANSPSADHNNSAVVPAPVNDQITPVPGGFNEIKAEAPKTVPSSTDPKTIAALDDLAKNPVIETTLQADAKTPEDSFGYQLRAWLSWILFLCALGWIVLPITLEVMPSIASGAFSLSKVFGLLLFAWLVWFSTSFKVCHFTLGSCWAWFAVLTVISGALFFKNRSSISGIFRKNKKSWLIQEALFAAAFLIFTIVRIYGAHVHDPVGEGYNGGGEAGMDFGFLSSVVRGDTFPPQNMWMAGMPIGYSFYFGHLMMGVLTKTLGLAPAVTYNLALITLFATIFAGAFGLAYSLSGRLSSGFLAGLLCAALGNLGAAKQYLDILHQCVMSGNLGALFGHTFDFWGPTRIIPNSINEFPYFSVLFGDMHAHTLAMPFAMLAIGIVASIYMSSATKPFGWLGEWPSYLAFGFLIGSIAFLNTWELPTWMVLFVLALLVKNLGQLNGKALQKGLLLFFTFFAGALVLLGWWGILAHFNQDNQALGGSTLILGLFLFLGVAAGIVALVMRSTTRVIASHFVSLGISVAAVLAAAVILWSPYFLNFNPQQNEILWVPERLRTHFGDFFTIYGAFVTVLAVAFVPVLVKEISKWLGASSRWVGFEETIESSIDFCSNILEGKDAVWGMFGLGLVSLMVIVASSWVHWSETDTTRLISQIFATVVFGVFVAAIHLRKRLELWGIGAFLLLTWVSLIVIKVLPLVPESSFDLRLGLFAVLWLAAFYYLGLAVKCRTDRMTSFAYVMTGLFFLIIAGLEVFVMHEYLGGDYMRNNSLFKFGINAWTLASVCVGVFAPQVYEALKKMIAVSVKETMSSKVVLFLASGAIVFAIISYILSSFASSLDGIVVHLLTLVLIGTVIALLWLENWFKDELTKLVLSFLLGVSLLFPLLALLPLSGLGGVASILQHWSADFSISFLLPFGVTAAVLVAVGFYYESKKNMGRQVFFQIWTISLAILLAMASIYPLAATVRKDHGFFSVFQKQWTGYAEDPTLNGLAYMSRVNTADAAAINFMNHHIPGQPCLVEFVGEGYNSWGSRFSIFTGIPALMGWDGHVKEWIGSRPGMEADIEKRFQATEQIFRSTDPVLAKKYLDAYGVRLVMVGTVERNGVPGRKGGYPPEGLTKFSTFLPLIYKNPEVEIYYNPPVAQN